MQHMKTVFLPEPKGKQIKLHWQITFLNVATQYRKVASTVPNLHATLRTLCQ